jgi:hypothetical protein
MVFRCIPGTISAQTACRRNGSLGHVALVVFLQPLRQGVVSWLVSEHRAKDGEDEKGKDDSASDFKHDYFLSTVVVRDTTTNTPKPTAAQAGIGAPMAHAVMAVPARIAAPV